MTVFLTDFQGNNRRTTLPPALKGLVRHKQGRVENIIQRAITTEGRIDETHRTMN